MFKSDRDDCYWLVLSFFVVVKENYLKSMDEFWETERKTKEILYLLLLRILELENNLILCRFWYELFIGNVWTVVT